METQFVENASININGVNCETKLAPALPWDKGAPVINGPAIYGATPGKDFLYAVPVVGERPLHFSAEGLPEGLSMDAAKGQISGKAAKRGVYEVLLKAENALGKSSKLLKLVIEENALALTPPMGWNSWNCYRGDVDAGKIKAIAQGMVSSGLAARGYCYVNIDSGWQSGKRGGTFQSVIPKDGFPDMKEFCGYIHSLGLKAGIYSGPYVVPWGVDVPCGTTSGLCDTSFPQRAGCSQKYIGLDKHEHEDVLQWAEWGFDYFKYDWSDTDMILAERMSRELKASSRDMVFSLTAAVHFKDAERVAALSNLWRSNADTEPNWESVKKNGFDNQQWNPVIGPGHWFDLDMTAMRPRDGKSLSQNELIAYISCWMMRPSPILLDCDPAQLDDFSTRLLCNEEIIAVNQDALGKPAASLSIGSNNGWDIQIKPLSDGTYALAFFNLNDFPAVSPKVDLRLLFGLVKFKVRDLWAKEDLGVCEKEVIAGVNARCAKVFKISPAQ